MYPATHSCIIYLIVSELQSGSEKTGNSKETTQQKDKKMKTINVTTIKNEKTITGSITAQMSTATIVSGLEIGRAHV